jgi:hypothetical protein
MKFKPNINIFKLYCHMNRLLIPSALIFLNSCSAQSTKNNTTDQDTVSKTVDEYPGGEEANEPYSGYIDWAYRLFSGLDYDQNKPAKTLGKEIWFYERLYVDTEVAFVEFQTDKSFHQRQFVLKNDTLVYAEEMETLLPVNNGDLWSYSYVIFKDTVVSFSAESTGDLEVESEEVKAAEIFKIWQTHKANFKKVKTALGFDGVKDVAAMEIYENYQLDNDTHIGKYMDAATPLKITISHNDKSIIRVIRCESEEEKRKFFIDDDKTRGNSRLVSIIGNNAVFELTESSDGVYIQELVFSDEMILMGIKLLDITE